MKVYHVIILFLVLLLAQSASARSLLRDKIQEPHKDLMKLIKAVEHVDLFKFQVIETHRNKMRQNDLRRAGKSQLSYPHSKHNHTPARAFDFVILIDDKVSWHAAEYYIAVGVFKAAAWKLGINIRVGADWDGDGDTQDQSFHDLGHIELKE